MMLYVIIFCDAKSVQMSILAILLIPPFSHTNAEAIVPKILRQLCSGSMTPTQHLEMQQALVKQFAEILEFTLKFDELKVCDFCEGHY